MSEKPLRLFVDVESAFDYLVASDCERGAHDTAYIRADAVEALIVAAQAMVQHPLSEPPSDRHSYRKRVKLWHALADALHDLEGKL